MTDPHHDNTHESHDGACGHDHGHGHGHGKMGPIGYICILIGIALFAFLTYNRVTNPHGGHGGHEGDHAAATTQEGHEADSHHDATHEGQPEKAMHDDHAKPTEESHEHEAKADEHEEEAGHADAGHAAGHGPPGKIPPYWACIPFAGLLLCIAVLPLIPATMHWWESNKNRFIVAATFGGLALLYYLISTGLDKTILVLDHAIIEEYIPFIILLFSLYVISGGINLSGDLEAKPLTNTAFIAVGGLIASFVGTTGAAMLLIRPLLQTNSQRKHVVHTVVFFIFLVCNVGGSLLPIGDPPLFLGYLKGVPFLWTLCLWPEWLAASIAILIVYFVWDTLAYRKEGPFEKQADHIERQPLRLTGKINFLWLIGVVFCVGTINPKQDIFGVQFPAAIHLYFREMVMLGLVALSLITTPRGVREANKFDYHAIIEVAALFIGIFIAMQIPIEILKVEGPNMGLTKSWQFFWATGALSSFLDNAPTYVVFFETAGTLPIPEGSSAVALLQGSISETLLIGISLGAVFMGAMTYIGNGPNFMVKSIAEQSGIRMPSFFGYMLYSVLILIPIFIVINLIFLVGH